MTTCVAPDGTVSVAAVPVVYVFVTGVKPADAAKIAI
jgi:hypothetical protein